MFNGRRPKKSPDSYTAANSWFDAIKYGDVDEANEQVALIQSAGRAQFSLV